MIPASTKARAKTKKTRSSKSRAWVLRLLNNNKLEPTKVNKKEKSISKRPLPLRPT